MGLKDKGVWSGVDVSAVSRGVLFRLKDKGVNALFPEHAVAALLAPQDARGFFQPPAQTSTQGGAKVTGQPCFRSEPAGKSVFLCDECHNSQPKSQDAGIDQIFSVSWLMEMELFTSIPILFS